MLYNSSSKEHEAFSTARQAKSPIYTSPTSVSVVQRTDIDSAESGWIPQQISVDLSKQHV